MKNEKFFFEMRRLEALSNTIFGVAMTLLAYNIPKGSLLSATPTLGEIWHSYAPHFVSLLLSFSVAGIFWFSHQRRLAYAPEAGRFTVVMNLLFLLSIILLPLTTGLYGSYLDASDITALYSIHLTMISALNLFLWLIAAAARRDWWIVAGPTFSTVVFLVASVVALFAPRFTKFLLPLAFVAPVIASFIEHKRK